MKAKTGGDEKLNPKDDILKEERKGLGDSESKMKERE